MKCTHQHIFTIMIIVVLIYIYSFISFLLLTNVGTHTASGAPFALSLISYFRPWIRRKDRGKTSKLRHPLWPWNICQGHICQSSPKPLSRRSRIPHFVIVTQLNKKLSHTNTSNHKLTDQPTKKHYHIISYRMLSHSKKKVFKLKKYNDY